MDRGAWWATVHGVAKNRTRLSDFHFITLPYPTVRNIFYIYDPFDWCSVAQSCPTLATPWIGAYQASLPFTISLSICKLMSIEPVMPSKHLILPSPFLLLPSVFPSIRVFANEFVLHISWLKYWSFSISPSEYSVLLSFSIDWFDLIAVQGTLKSLLQHHSWKASIL